ncbi:putative RNA methyltransferase bin3 [Portunus trituberculatus]|uniref:Putative RNA methyltransferase bin3 n=1 Tax=Portunus trituberculatus TaxID=210409 RepID=A0A5B7E0Z7_PORTR|nr:putative RNA methyltransferase bin3 [Portunus trituberculatus]
MFDLAVTLLKTPQKRIFDNYKSICLFPDKFNDFLLHEVGFSTSEKLVTPNHTARGFQRPIIIYTKAGGSTKSSPVGESSTANTSVATTTTAATITTSVIGDDDVFSTEAIGHSKEPSQKKGEKRRRDSEKAEESPLIKEAQRQQQEQHKDSCPSRQPHTRVHNCDKAPIPCTSCPTSEKVVHEREGPASSGVASPKPTVTPDSNCSKPLAVEIGKKTNEDREEHRDSIKAERSTDLSTLSIPNTLNQHCGREGTLGQAKRKMPGCEDKEEATKRVRLGNT